MNKIFGLEEPALAAILGFSPEQLEICRGLESKFSEGEHQVICEIISALEKQKSIEWMTEGHDVYKWLNEAHKNSDLLFQVVHKVAEQETSLKYQEIDETTKNEIVEVVLNTLWWLEQSIRAGVFKKMNQKSLEIVPASTYKKRFPTVKSVLMERAATCTWQERLVLDNYLTGFEQNLNELEVQDILLA